MQNAKDLKDRELVIRGDGAEPPPKWIGGGISSSVLFFVIGLAFNNTAFMFQVLPRGSWNLIPVLNGTALPLMILSGLTLAISIILPIIFMFSKATSIFVYENIIKVTFIKGKAQDSENITLEKDIQIFFDEIKKVEVSDNNRLILHTEYMDYTAYTQKCNEVRAEIMRLIDRNNAEL